MNLREAARALAQQNGQAESSIQTIYWFPDPKASTIHLLEVTEELPRETKEIADAFYFSSTSDIPYKIGIGLIKTDEVCSIAPPQGWAGWDKAEIVWKR